MTTHDLIQLHATNFKRMAKLSLKLPDTLEAIDLFTADGYPTSVPMSSQDATNVVQILDGLCTEPTKALWGYRSGEWGKWAHTCDSPRPCPEHDTAIKLTSVEQAGTNRTRSNDERLITIAERKIAKALDELETVAMRNSKPQPAPTPCSTGTGREGHSTTKYPDGITWGNPLCRNIPDPRCSGMCLVCFHELMNPWHVAHNLEPVEMTEGNMCRRGCGREADRNDGLCNADRLKDSRARRAS